MKSLKNIVSKELLEELNIYLNKTKIEDFKTEFLHFPVMIREVLFFKNQIKKQDPVFLDCTLGSAGHSFFLYQNQKDDAIFFAMERDFRMIQIAENRLKSTKIPYILLNSSLDENLNIDLLNSKIKFYIIHKRFSFAKDFLLSIQKKVDFLICDLGISMHHLKEDWGFSYKNKNLDFGLDQQTPDTKEIINQYSEKELYEILHIYGEEKLAKKIAKEIIINRPINSAIQLKNLILKVYAKTYKKYVPEKVVQRAFQAFRIYVNSELEELKTLLDSLDMILNPKGIAIFISFHSLEDKIIKDYSRQKNATYIVLKKPILPTLEECKINPSSNSARMRILWKI